MNVSSTSNSLTRQFYKAANDGSIEQDYKALIEHISPAKAHKTRDEINAEDSALAQFKEDLVTKGAALFLKEFNEEKIEAMVEEYRQKLLAEQEQNPENPIDIDQMVNDFRKQLLEELMEAQKAGKEKESRQNIGLSSSDLLENIKTMRNSEVISTQSKIGFLEQMLITSSAEAKKKELE